MIYIKSVVIVSLNNNKFLVISICINKDLFIILPITKKYIEKHKIKKNKIKHKSIQAQSPSPAKRMLAKMAPTKNIK